MAITYELDRDLSIIRRKVYRFLDLLSDIGGLAGTLFALFSVLIVVFQYKSVISDIRNYTYLIRDGDEIDNPA